MKTMYYKTNSFVRREGNVIDFTEYRSRVQRQVPATVPAAVGDDCSFHWEVDDSVWHYEEPRPVRRARRHTRSRFGLADLLEIAAAGGTLALVITVWAQFLF